MDKNQPDKFKRWMIASLFLIPLVIFGSIGAYYAYIPVEMNILIYLLRYDKTKGWACRRLRSQGKNALPYVIKGLWNKDPKVRTLSLLTFAGINSNGIKDERSVPRLIGLLSHPNARVRAGAAKGLTILPDERAVPGLLRLLSDSDAHVRSRVAGALGEIRDEAAVPGLIKLLSDSDAKVRASAADALGNMALKKPVAAERALPALIKLVSDQDQWVRQQAAFALGEIGDQSALPGLIKLLFDGDIRVRMRASLALRKIGSIKAVGGLIACLEERPMRGVSPDDWGRFQSYVMEALQEITGERQRIAKRWVKWWEENKEKYEAAISLGAFTDERVLSGLIKLLSDPDLNVRRAAAGALGDTGSGKAVSPLIFCLKQKPPPGASPGDWQHFQYSVIRALARITGQNLGDIRIATDAETQQIIQRWLEWWEENKDSYQEQQRQPAKE